MTPAKSWCHYVTVHPSHWLNRGTFCPGVTRDEAAVMAVTVETGYDQTTELSLEDAQAVIAALDKARGET